MKNWMKKQVAVLLTLVLAFSVTVPVAAEGTDDSVQKVTVTLSGQANNEFLFAPGEYIIPSNEAEKYGYEDEAGGVTTLDALVYAHELAYGDKFTKETKDKYLTVTDGSVSKAFETECDEYSFDFVVNEQRPHTEEYDEWLGYDKCTISQGKLKDKDRVGYFFYQDIFFDACTWFEQGGQKVTNLVLQENETKDLVLRGYTSYYMTGSGKEETIKENVGGIPNAPLTLIKIGEKAASPINITGELGEETTVGLTTDEVGNVTLPNLQAGDYYLSAYVTKVEGIATNPIIMPLCKLQVKAKEVPKPEPTPTPEPKKDPTTQATTTEAKKEEKTTEAATEAPTTQQEVVLDKPSGDKVKSTKKKQIKITLKARKNITGYQIEVSTSSKFKKAKVYKVKNTVSSKTIKGLKSKKTYYVRIRTYNQFVENNQKVTIYSKWSKVSKLKVK